MSDKLEELEVRLSVRISALESALETMYALHSCKRVSAEGEQCPICAAKEASDER